MVKQNIWVLKESTAMTPSKFFALLEIEIKTFL